MKRTLTFGLILVLGGCAGFTTADRLLQPEQIAASAVANRSIALGISDWRAGLGITAICIGSATPTDEQAAFQRTMVRRLADTAPIVADARDCEPVGSGSWRVKDLEIPAIRLGVTSITWRSDQIGSGNVGVVLDGQTRFGYEIRVTRRDGPWITDDVFCSSDLRLLPEDLPGTGNNFCVSINPRITG